MGFVKCSPSVKYCFAMWNALRRVRGFISFSFRVSEKFHNDWMSLFHIRRILHFTIRPFCWIIRIREGGDCMSESKVWDLSADFAVRIKSYAKQSTVIIKRHISVFFSQNKYTWKQQTGQPLRSPGLFLLWFNATAALLLRIFHLLLFISTVRYQRSLAASW